MSLRSFTKCRCVIDTCSIINLDGVEVGKKNVLKQMRQYCDIQVSPTIRDELKRHQSKLKSREGSVWPQFISSEAYRCKQYGNEEKRLGSFFTSKPAQWGAGDAGERGNACVSVELLLKKSAGHIVFVTDDEKAQRTFLDRFVESFPGVKVWNSADVVLYFGGLLMHDKQVIFDEVKNAVRDVYARLLSWEDGAPPKDAVIKKRSAKIECLKRLDQTIKG
jgi:hypothetical protein